MVPVYPPGPDTLHLPVRYRGAALLGRGIAADEAHVPDHLSGVAALDDSLVLVVLPASDVPRSEAAANELITVINRDQVAIAHLVNADGAPVRLTSLRSDAGLIGGISLDPEGRPRGVTLLAMPDNGCPL